MPFAAMSTPSTAFVSPLPAAAPAPRSTRSVASASSSSGFLRLRTVQDTLPRRPHTRATALTTTGLSANASSSSSSPSTSSSSQPCRPTAPAAAASPAASNGAPPTANGVAMPHPSEAVAAPAATAARPAARSTSEDLTRTVTIASPPSAARVTPSAPTATAWEQLRREAREAAAEEPLLASFMFATVLNHRSLPSALAFHLANKLASSAIPATQLMRLFADVLAGEVRSAGTAKDPHAVDPLPPPGYGAARTGATDPSNAASSQRQAQIESDAVAQRAELAARMENCLHLDLLAVMDRDPACNRYLDCLCYYKGFHALQAYRISHELWRAGKVALAYYLQTQVSKELQVDIHPAAVIGPGAFLDHATGIVIGETCSIGKNVSMLHHVTLGGSGSRHGVRHPQIGDGVLIGAGATILGNINVGDYAQIGAGSLVLENVPQNATVVGVPARVVGRSDPNGVAGKVVPALEMKHERCLGDQAPGVFSKKPSEDGI